MQIASKEDSTTTTVIKTGNEGKGDIHIASAPHQARPEELTAKRRQPAPLDMKQLEGKALGQSSPETPKKENRSTINETSSQPSTPAAVSQTSTSSASRQPRTLRVLPSSKSESTTKPVAAPLLTKQISRQPSLASINQPSTPLTDLISDNASLTSTSLSRPPSPSTGSRIPPSSSRQKTKSQAKKDRQNRAKQLEELKATTNPIPSQDEIVQAPILGRKKKTRKGKDVKVAPDNSDGLEPSLETASVPATTGDVDSHSVEKPTLSDVKQASPQDIDVPSMMPKSEKPTQSVERPVSAQVAILKGLQKAGIIQASELDLFLNVPGVNQRSDIGEHNSSLTIKELDSLSTDQRQRLRQGEAISLELSGQEHAVVLPGYVILRHFSREEAARYMKLWKNLSSRTTSAFHPSRLGLRGWSGFNAGGIPTAGLGADSKTSTSNYIDMTIELDSMMRQDEGGFAFGVAQKPASPPANDGLSLEIGSLTLEEVEHVLKTSEEVVNAARKSAEALEKKLNGALKKNKKILREVY